MAPEPVLCFDGDAAGRRAAFRAVETVLPHLKPGFSVQFAFLPDGLDPDDLIRQHGAAAFQAMLDTQAAAAVRRADASARSSRASRPSRPSSAPPSRRGSGPRRPHRRPPACAAVRARAARDPVGEEPQARARAGGLRWPPRRPLCRQAPRQHRSSTGALRRARDRAVAPRQPTARRQRSASLPCAATSLPSAPLPLPAREALLIATLLNHPWLLEARCEEVAELALTSPPLARLRDALLELLAQQHRP